jgi:protein-tyrosine phosphatase
VQQSGECVSLRQPPRQLAELGSGAGERDTLPALFHCTTGKDRTGWAAAALLELLGVPRDIIMADYLRSNETIIPKYQDAIAAFIAADGEPAISEAILGVQEAYLNAAFGEMELQYGAIENYFAEGLGIDANGQQALREVYLGLSQSFPLV